MDLVKLIFVSKFLPSCSCQLFIRTRPSFLLKLCLQFLHFTYKICPDQAYMRRICFTDSSVLLSSFLQNQQQRKRETTSRIFPLVCFFLFKVVRPLMFHKAKWLEFRKDCYFSYYVPLLSLKLLHNRHFANIRGNNARIRVALLNMIFSNTILACLYIDNYSVKENRRNNQVFCNNNENPSSIFSDICMSIMKLIKS